MRFLVKSACSNLSPVLHLSTVECKLWTITFHTLLHLMMCSHLFTHCVNVLMLVFVFFLCSLLFTLFPAAYIDFDLSRADWCWSTNSIFVFILSTSSHCLCFTTLSSCSYPLISCWVLKGVFSVPALFVLLLKSSDCIHFLEIILFLDQGYLKQGRKPFSHQGPFQFLRTSVTGHTYLLNMSHSPV